MALSPSAPSLRTPSTSGPLTVVGGGLAGCEAAWQAAEQGADVRLFEMRPRRATPAHVTDRLAELVCSNSLGSDLPDRADGVLKAEMRRLGSLILACAEASALPAGGALAVDREGFAEAVTARIEAHPRIELRREEVLALPDDPCVVATGPLTSDALAGDIARATGQEHLYFFDALSPIVEAESIDMGIAFRQSRYDRGEREDGDYINCPMDEAEFSAFYEALVAAERIELRDFEKDAEGQPFFDRCLPIEVIAERGAKSLTFGPMRPVGLTDPRTGRRPFAVVQLRQDDVAGSLYNLVGFQTNLRWPEQARVLRMIPGLAEAEFVRLGQMHRNTFLDSPTLLTDGLQMRARPGTFFAGQITGIEGYSGNAASGIVAATNALRVMRGAEPLALPPSTMLGALCHYVSHADPKHFQPMKSNFGIMPPLATRVRKKPERYKAYAARAAADLEAFLSETGWHEAPAPFAMPAAEAHAPAAAPAARSREESV